MKWVDIAKAWAVGFNWQLWLAKGIIVILLCVGLYQCGAYNQRVEFAQEAAQRAEANAKVITKYVEKRIPVVVEKERIAIQTRTVTKTIKEKLDDENKNSAVRPECKLSPSELQHYRTVAEQTRVY